VDGSVGLIVWAVGIAIYMVPTIVAVRSAKRNAGVIFILNLVLGWTVVGWVVALVWAIKFDRAQPSSSQRAADAAAAPVTTQPTLGSTPSSEPGSPLSGQRMQLMVDTVARENPEAAAAIRVELTKGTEVTVIYTSGSWAWVQTDADEEGWVAF
jgi:hypothetical protein